MGLGVRALTAPRETRVRQRNVTVPTFSRARLRPRRMVQLPSGLGSRKREGCDWNA